MRKQGTPFRWNVGNPGLGRRLGRPGAPEVSPELGEALLRTAASVVRAAGDADLVFVGRSPESLHDFLAGALERTTWRDRPQLLQLSLRCSLEGLRRARPQALDELGRYLGTLGLTPPRIMKRPRPVAFIDLVDRGETFSNLLEALREWASPAQWGRMLGRMRWVCLLAHRGPTVGLRALDEAAFAKLLPADTVSCVAVKPWFWCFLGNRQPKTTESHTPEQWGQQGATRPSSEKGRVEAARLARAIFRLGERSWDRLAAELGRPPAPAPWLAGLIRELRLR